MAHEFRDGACVTCHLTEAAFNESLGMSVKCEPGLYAPPDDLADKAIERVILGQTLALETKRPLFAAWQWQLIRDRFQTASVLADTPHLQEGQMEAGVNAARQQEIMNAAGCYHKARRQGNPFGDALTYKDVNASSFGMSADAKIDGVKIERNEGTMTADELERRDAGRRREDARREDKRRLKIFAVTDYVIHLLFGMWDKVGGTCLVRPKFPQLPADADIQNVQWDPMRRQWAMCVHSMTFEPALEGAYLPEGGVIDRAEREVIDTEKNPAFAVKRLKPVAGDLIVLRVREGESRDYVAMVEKLSEWFPQAKFALVGEGENIHTGYQCCAVCKGEFGGKHGGVADAAYVDKVRSPRPMHEHCADVFARLKNGTPKQHQFAVTWAASDFDPKFLADMLLFATNELHVYEKAALARLERVRARVEIESGRMR